MYTEQELRIIILYYCQYCLIYEKYVNTNLLTQQIWFSSIYFHHVIRNIIKKFLDF